MTKNLKDLQCKIGYDFKNENLLKNALCHKSFINESKDKNISSYERLEFLGDSVLGVVVTRYIYDNFASFPEGSLSKLRASVVCEQSLSEIARTLNIGQYIILSKGEEMNKGYDKDAILCDVFESVVAAMYLDSDMETAKEFILRTLKETIDENALLHQGDSDYKTSLQEYAQQHDKTVRYDIINETGPDHDKEYTTALYLDDIKLAVGVGSSKKKAHQDAAKKALEILK